MLVQRDEESGGHAGLVPGSDYVVATVVVLVLWALTLLSFNRLGTLAIAHTLTFNVVVATASLLVSLGAAYFVLIEFTLYGRLASFYVGTAFLVFGMANGVMGLIPLFAGWTGSTSTVPYVWAAQRMVGAALLILAPFALDREIPVLGRRRMVAVAAFVTIVESVGTSVLVARTSAGGVPHAVQTAIELIASVLFFGASALFWRARRATRSPWFLGLALALTVAGFAELQYAIHPYTAGVAQFGDILRLVFYSGILLILSGEGSRGYRILRWQARELSALQALMSPPAVQDVTRVIEHVADVVGQTLQADARVILTGRDEHERATSPLLGILGLRAPASEGLRDVQTVLVGSDDDASGRSVVAVPLRTAERQFGTLLVERPRRADFSPQDVRLLRAFGIQASVVIERSLLYEEVAAGAVIEERARLAREIHDGLAQHLAFLKMRVSWLKRSPSALDVGQLIDLESVLETALTEARTAITTLRAEPEGTSTVEAIGSYAFEFGQVAGLTVQVDVDDDVPEVGPKVRVELMRVVQEALNNVRKHANAANVLVRITAADGGMDVSIHDDGSGFSLKEELQGHFGMDIMSERAQSIGGLLNVVSAPHRGTRVHVWVPATEAHSATRVTSRL